MPVAGRMTNHITLPANAEQLIGPAPSSAPGSTPIGTFFDDEPVNVSVVGNMGDIIKVDLKLLVAYKLLGLNDPAQMSDLARCTSP